MSFSVVASALLRSCSCQGVKCEFVSSCDSGKDHAQLSTGLRPTSRMAQHSPESDDLSDYTSSTLNSCLLSACWLRVEILNVFHRGLALAMD